MEKRMLDLYTDFVPPEEAKVYYPTAQEFKDPIQYVHSIRAEAEHLGVIKIVPPRNAFNHKCVINPETFRFDTRFQKLCGIDMLCRDRMYFVKQLELFWFNQGQLFQWPYFNDSYVDMKRLYELVIELGGPAEVNRTQKWPEITRTLGFQLQNTNAIRDIYNKWLQPFKERFLDPEKQKESEDVVILSESDNSANPDEHDCPSPPMLTSVKEPTSSDQNTEEPPVKRQRKSRLPSIIRSKDMPTLAPTTNLLTETCGVCQKPVKDMDRDYVSCSGCFQDHHFNCAFIKKPSNMKETTAKWKCQTCLKKDLKEYEFYFVDNETTKTLKHFKEKADLFKRKHFKVVPIETVEKDYWRQVCDFENRVEVEYGADLESQKLGSGFPRPSDELRGPDADRRQYFARHPWNLNNLPVLDDSALSHVGSDISGMVLPWVYVGMCFSTFCWHVEDHWTYSMNYMHLGEPKVWYGFGREYADKFEQVMRKISPDLFRQNPTMLNTMHNMLNPRILMEHGIPVKTVRQKAGEFVVTFPRAYHAGFNAGLNVAEAVNFAPFDWLEIGRLCVENYMRTNRCCVFAHDELIFNLARSPKRLSLGMLAAIYTELAEISDRETRFRADLSYNKVKTSEYLDFGQVPDDDRSCAICGTTLFVTGLEADVSGTKKRQFACSKHWRSLLKKYNLTMQEIRKLKDSILEKVKEGDEWRHQVTKQLKMQMTQFEAHQLLAVWNQKRLPMCEEKKRLDTACHDHMELSQKAKRVLEQKVKLRDDTRIQRADDRLSPAQLADLINQFRGSSIVDAAMIKKLEDKYAGYANWATSYHKFTDTYGKDPKTDADHLDQMKSQAEQLNMKLDEMDNLRTMSRNLKWCHEVEVLLNDIELKEEEKKNATRRSLAELEQFNKNAPSGTQITKVEQNLADKLANVMQKADEKLKQLAEFVNGPEGRSNRTRGFDDVIKFNDHIKDVDWLETQELIAFREEFDDLLLLKAQFDSIRTSGSYKMSQVYHLMRQIDKNPLLLNAPEMEVLERIRDELVLFIHNVRDTFVKPSTYHSTVQCLLPRRDLPSMIEVATEKLYKQVRDQMSEEWGDIRHVADQEQLATFFQSHDPAETLRLLAKARERNAAQPVSSTCIDAPSCSRHCDSAPADQPDAVECFLCLQKQHVSCAPWSEALDRYPPGLYLCCRCCRTRRPTSEQVAALVAKSPARSIEAQLLKARTDDILDQWNWARSASWKEGEPSPLHYALTLEVHDGGAWADLLARHGPAFDEAQRRAWSGVRARANPAPLTTAGLKEGLLASAKRRRTKCLRTRAACGGAFAKRHCAPALACGIDACLQFAADYYRELQCAHCENWFHLACTGLALDAAKALNQYLCPACAKLDPKPEERKPRPDPLKHSAPPQPSRHSPRKRCQVVVLD